jgi:DNA polymerase I-like protein with 3'-5' exonuclease and polymerase domains
VLNFSIAYGKTAHGLSRDWGTSLKEAQETVERWYADRPEVRALVTHCMQTEARQKFLCLWLSLLIVCLRSDQLSVAKRALAQ